MQQLTRLMRRLVYPTAVLFLVWAGYKVIASPYISENNGTILVVYNADAVAQDCTDVIADRENLSEQALTGLCKAVDKHGPTIVLINLHENLQEQGQLKDTGVYEQIAAELAHTSVLGVVSLLTSVDSRPVVRFCRAMQIPLLLAFAANDNLLAPAEDTQGIVFRMTPRNGQQARDLAEWIRNRLRAKPKFRMALFHEANTYGEFLNRRLSQELQREIENKDVLLYDFEVPDQPEFADLMPLIWCDRFDLAVYLGYQSKALDLLNKLRWFRADKDQVSCEDARSGRGSSGSFEGLPVLLSDGAYQSSLNETDKYNFPFKLYAALPTNATEPNTETYSKDHTPRYSPKPADLEISSQYGYDAYTLMTRLGMERKGNSYPGELYKTLSKTTEQSKTGYDYKFQEDGELTPLQNNRFQVYELNWNKPTAGKGKGKKL